MGFFDPSSEVLNVAPKVAKGTSAANARLYLNNLLGMYSGGQFPMQGVAGMSDAEKTGQGILGNIMSGGAFQDPLTSPLWSGLRGQSQTEEADAVGALRHRQNLGGMFRSSPGQRAEGEMRSSFANNRSTMLGSLYERERERDNPYTRLAAVQQYGGLPRQIEQAKYNAIIEQYLGPLQYIAQLAQQIIGNEMWYNPTVLQGPSMAAEIGGLLGGGGQAAGGIAKIMAA